MKPYQRYKERAPAGIKDMTPEQRRTYFTERKREWRARQRDGGTPLPKPHIMCCNTCNTDKPFTEAYYSPTMAGTWGLKKQCRDCVRLRQLASEYGVTVDEYKVKTSGECTICYEPVRLVLDHCHATGQIRGGLCSNCNTGLGMFRDDPIRLSSAMEYLARHELLG